MQKIVFFLTILAATLPLISSSQKLPSHVDEVCLSGDEEKLFKEINAYRLKRGLPEIEFSKSLTYVAQRHVRDLYENEPHRSKGCNLHSWSINGNWTGCCYTSDLKSKECMWKKPSELSEYDGYGYEIASGPKNIEDKNNYWIPEKHLKGWKKSNGHNRVILNKGKWKKIKWQSMGLAIYKSYAVVWFGKEKDPINKGLSRCTNSSTE